MIQFSQIQLTCQKPSHVEITKMLSTGQSKSGIIDCWCKKVISEEEAGY